MHMKTDSLAYRDHDEVDGEWENKKINNPSGTKNKTEGNLAKRKITFLVHISLKAAKNRSSHISCLYRIKNKLHKMHSLFKS